MTHACWTKVDMDRDVEQAVEDISAAVLDSQSPDDKAVFIAEPVRKILRRLYRNWHGAPSR